jgi:hypothetical protein
VWQELGKPPNVNCQNNAIKIMHISTLQEITFVFHSLTVQSDHASQTPKTGNHFA